MDEDDFACQEDVIEVFHSFKEAEDAKRAYAWSLTSLTPQQRLAILQRLREQRWGDLAQAKIQKVFEFTRAPSRADRLASEFGNLPEA